jgi:hypothetical protein
MPFNDNPLIYGPGLHTMAAFSSKILNTYPGESVLMVGSFLAALLPLFVYAFSYFKTGSYPLSALAFCATFLIHPSADLQRWVFGYYFNGAFPPIGGMLFGLLLFFILSLPSDPIRPFRKSTAIIFTLVGIGIVHYGFLPPLLSSLFIYLIYKNKSRILNRRFLISVGLVLIVGVPLIAILDLGTTYLFEHRNKEYSIQRSEILGSYSSIAILVSTLSAVWFLISRRDKVLPICVLSINIPLLVSSILPPELYGSTFGIYYLSLRMFNFATLLSWIFFAITLQELKVIERVATFLQQVGRNWKIYSRPIFTHNSVNLLVLIIIAILFSSVFLPYVSGNLIRIQGKPLSVLSTSEYGALRYVAEHLSLNDTIAADPSRSSIHLLGFKPLNSLLNFPLLIGKVNQTRAANVTSIFEHPGNYSNIRNLAEKYNIKYLLINDEIKGYFDYFNAKRGERGQFVETSVYKYKPFTRNTYLNIFDHNPYLEAIYRDGFSALYRVNFHKVDNSTLTVDNLAPADHESSIDPSSEISVDFNKAVDPASINNSVFTLSSDRSLRPIDGEVRVNEELGGYRISFKPNKSLAENSTYTATIRAGIRDQSGNVMNSSKSWSFTPADCTWLPRKGISVSVNPNVSRYAMDTRLNTSWITKENRSWLQLDIGSSYPLCALYISWYRGDQAKYAFSVLTSNDSRTYKHILDTQSSGNYIPDEWQRYLLNDTLARFIKLEIHGNSDEMPSGVSEFAVKGLLFDKS